MTARVVGMNPGDYASEFDEVVNAGGSVVTYSSSGGLYVHAKMIVADAGTSSAREFVGSENFSDNSLNHNRELGLIIDDAGVRSGLESAFGRESPPSSPALLGTGMLGGNRRRRSADADGQPKIPFVWKKTILPAHVWRRTLEWPAIGAMRRAFDEVSVVLEHPRTP